MPSFIACCRSEPAVRFINLTILATGVLAFECALSSLLSCLDQGRRVSFRFFAVFVLFFFAIVVSLESANWSYTQGREDQRPFGVTHTFARRYYNLAELLTHRAIVDMFDGL